MLKSFRELIVWQKAFAFAVKIYQVTESFPTSEKFGLTSQLRRAGLSIVSNIAEGYYRGTRKDYAYFLDNAFGSSAEVETQILFAEALKYLSEKIRVELLTDLSEVQKILNVMRKRLRDSL